MALMLKIAKPAIQLLIVRKRLTVYIINVFVLMDILTMAIMKNVPHAILLGILT